ncbi:hypothetical protein Tco_0370668 [Tanacetum coccineum]
MRIEESLNVTFDESFPEPKSSSSVKDDRINEPIVQDLNGSPSLQVNVLDEGYPKSLKEDRGHPIGPKILKEARGHPIGQVIGELNERTLRTEKKREALYENIQTTHVVEGNSFEIEFASSLSSPLLNNNSDFDIDIYLSDEEDNGNNVPVRKDMFSSINETIKRMLSVAINMSCVVENDIGKEESKDNLKE